MGSSPKFLIAPSASFLIVSLSLLKAWNSALKILVDYNYPGNIRELENIIEHAFVLCKNSLILPQHLPDDIFPSTFRFQNGRLTSQHKTLKEGEKEMIIEALNRNNWNQVKAAGELGINKTTLWRKLKKYNMFSSRSS